tara:strand:- start:997 stop:1356 length:360 start_codon:yes stop_codon:yes gene_type:complete
MIKYFPLIFAIIIRTLTDISFKAAVNNVELKFNKNLLSSLKSIFTNPFLWMGLLFGILNVLAWMAALKNFNLSYAYPFLSISYITIILSGKLLFNEHLDKYKLTGIGFIIIGAIILVVS